ncbi:MAG TPA: ParB/RepB/Spo0J family partition protein [Oscillospiraceae bacterium]|mgnify:CR=1 FL=1|nr:ParB/RepB/Spo0J family partition protein [Oscillospiraceae bacterium]
MADKKGFDLSSILGDVSKLDTAVTSGGVAALPAEQIHANDKNFYDVSNVDTLLDAILLDGLQSPLVVNQRGEGDYVIISGHRRFKALQQILAAGDKIPDGKLFAADINAGRIPCFVNHYSSDLEAELALIRANSDTRVLTSAEISKQAERVELLLYGLKEQGYSFPGKMRDYVAECCKVSASKLARLKVIREKLIPEYYAEYEKGGPRAINESVAYELAQLPEYRQKMIKVENQSMWTGSPARLSSYIDNIESIMPCAECEGAPCENAGNMFHWMAKNDYYDYMPCEYGKNCCCKGCDKLTTCKAACPKLADKIKDKKAAARAKIKAENAKIRDEEKQKANRCEKLFRRMQQAMDRGGLNEKAACEAMGRYYYKGVLNPPEKFTPSSAPISREYLDMLCGLAGACGCSADFLLCLTDIPDPPDKLVKKVDAVIKTETPAPDWRTDTDYTPGWCVAQVQMSEGAEPVMQLLYRSSYCWRFARTSAPIEDIDIVAWYPVPERREAHDGKDC